MTSIIFFKRPEFALFLVVFSFLCLVTSAQHQHHNDIVLDGLSKVENVEAQPLLSQALRVADALSYIGNALPAHAMKRLQALKDLPYDASTVKSVQEILDPYCLAEIEINPEARVKVNAGPAKPDLLQEGWKSYLVKVHNQAHTVARLMAESPNASPLFYTSTFSHRMLPKNKLTAGQLDNSFLQMAIYRDRPLQQDLSGLELEYSVLQLYTRSRGKREATIGFNVGQGTQDIAFRNAATFLFDIKPAVRMVFDVRDDDNSPTMASFIITDHIERFGRTKERTITPWRLPWRDWENPKMDKPVDTVALINKLSGIYPLPSRRLAMTDTYPDFNFQPQVYRSSGEYVYLSPGTYDVVYTRGPEYLPQYQKVIIPANRDSMGVSFKLKRWIQMSKLGWYSADHHIHAAGCSHYESPEEGVKPLDMFRQIKGEDLNIGSNLSWGPSWYYQKQFFTGKDHPLSDTKNLLRYDVEVSGFPSSHAGHLCLLNLKEDDYPNTKVIEDWPSWTLPVLQWAKSQGGITAYAHSGWGLEPVTPTSVIPNYVMPKLDGIGANEYIVTVTRGVVDYYSLGDTPVPWELNMWYHTLNCGFRTRIGGETDFPCISDERVGLTRSYAKLKGELTFAGFMDCLKKGSNYVSDGFSHLIDFKVNELEAGEGNSELSVAANSNLTITVNAAAMLSEVQDETGKYIASRLPEQPPYWNIERARIGSSRNIPVELIVNGQSVEKKPIAADGHWQKLSFNYKIKKSCWIAVRVTASSHTNPVFVVVDGKPIVEQKSAIWCRDAVDRCWATKSPSIRKEELEAAKTAYDHARKVYQTLIEE
ncbi:MAG: CehA/McbA family metallohydrolase [Bacteroidota bacterium]|nr:CehA/McbA family metallohydrolase [Bacteroidota bacterium]